MTNATGADVVAMFDREWSGIAMILLCPLVVVLATLGVSNPAWLLVSRERSSLTGLTVRE